MLLRYHSAYQLRIRRHQIFENEKRSGDVLLFQHIEDPRHIAVFVACVKGQIDHAFSFRHGGMRFVDAVAAVFFNILHLRGDRWLYPVGAMGIIPPLCAGRCIFSASRGKILLHHAFLSPFLQWDRCHALYRHGDSQTKRQGDPFFCSEHYSFSPFQRDWDSHAVYPAKRFPDEHSSVS